VPSSISFDERRSLSLPGGAAAIPRFLVQAGSAPDGLRLDTIATGA